MDCFTPPPHEVMIEKDAFVFPYHTTTSTQLPSIWNHWPNIAELLGKTKHISVFTLCLLGKLQPWTVTLPSSFCMWALTCRYWAFFCSLREGELHWSALRGQKTHKRNVIPRQTGWTAHMWCINVDNSPLVDKVKDLGLLCGELGESAAPLHQVARRVVFYVGLRLNLLDDGGGTKQSAEAAGWWSCSRQRHVEKKQGGESPTNQAKENFHRHSKANNKICWNFRAA